MGERCSDTIPTVSSIERSINDCTVIRPVRPEARSKADERTEELKIPVCGCMNPKCSTGFGLDCGNKRMHRVSCSRARRNQKSRRRDELHRPVPFAFLSVTRKRAERRNRTDLRKAV